MNFDEYQHAHSINFEAFELVLATMTTEEEKKELTKIAKSNLDDVGKELASQIYLLKRDHIIRKVIYHNKPKALIKI